MKRGQTERGFSLVELMVTLAIMAIIAMVAMPSYMESVTSSRRADGQIALNMLAQQLERCFTQFGRYDDADCDPGLPRDSREGFYSVAAVTTASSYALSATPKGAQARDARCGVLSLTSTGIRSASGTATERCW
jgi:type IV pilus assembly protein PilE